MRTWAAALAVAVLAGCGGRPALGQQQFDARADAVCQGVDATVVALPPPVAGNLASLATYTQGVLEAYGQVLMQLDPIVARAKDAGQIRAQWIGPDTRQLALERPVLLRLVAAARAGNRAAVAAATSMLAALPDGTRNVTAYERSYGATDCATLDGDLRG